MTNSAIVYTTFPSKEAAVVAAQILVQGKFAACANIIDSTSSVYMWENKIENSKEVVMILKILKKKIAECKCKLEEIHPYEVPCVLEIDCTASEKFLGFMKG